MCSDSNGAKRRWRTREHHAVEWPRKPSTFYPPVSVCDNKQNNKILFEPISDIDEKNVRLG